MSLTFRFDDVTARSDMELTNAIATICRKKFPDCRIIYCISPLICDMSGESDPVTKQRIFPKIWNAYSDYRKFFNVDIAEMPVVPPWVEIASHSLIHVDHRLLSKEAQEMSILVSASLCKSKIFVPPFNKWNKDTDDICQRNGITLIHFESGWRCAEYEPFDKTRELWYLHAREFTIKSFTEWINK